LFGVTLIRGILSLLALVNRRRSQDVSLSAMSALAHRSPFNLHRRFVEVTGETPKGYTSRVRLSRAAAELVATDRPVSAIAHDHGYASHEVFTRAFTRHFGIPPSAYRARGLHVEDDRSARIHADVVASVAPCIGLYHLTTTTKETCMSVDIVVKDLPELHALVMRRRIVRDQIAETLGSMLPVLFGYAQSNGLAIAGPPLSRYPEIGMGSMVIEGGVPLAAPAPHQPDQGIEALTIPAGPAAVAIHRGPYERLHETYQAIEEWIQAQGHAVAGPPWETYLTDPGERPDPETWETEIVQPIR
jgi:AraC family transcriptional regulator